MIKCSNYWCLNKFEYGHNGNPLYKGRVCDKCNDDVINERIRRLNSAKR